MKQKKDKKIVKIILKNYNNPSKKGTIYTIDVSEENEEFIAGTDKFGDFVKVNLDDIRNVFPVSGTSVKW